MTDTIKISRELAERIADCLGDDPFERTEEELRAVLAQPSEPQGGEEVEVVAWLSPSTVEAVIPGAGHDVLAGEGRELIELMTVAQHRRLMAEQMKQNSDQRAELTAARELLGIAKTVLEKTGYPRIAGHIDAWLEKTK